MDLNKAIKVLKEYQEWRTGAEIPQPKPELITEALEVAINILSGLKQP